MYMLEVHFEAIVTLAIDEAAAVILDAGAPLAR